MRHQILQSPAPFERIIGDQLYPFFEYKKLCNCNQHGFRKKRSTEAAALELIDKLITELDEDETPINIYGFVKSF